MKVDLLKLSHLFWAGSFSIAVFLVTLPSYALSVEEVPNPRQVHGGWVTDMANILSDKTETQLNGMISRLEASNGAEMAVVTVPQTAPASSPKEFTTKLFNYWGIGKKDQDNGVLFLISVKDKRVEIETGYGVEAILPDAKVGNIIDTKIIPRFKQRDFDGGALAGTKALIVTLEPSLGKELGTNVSSSPVPSVPDQKYQENKRTPPENTGIFWIWAIGGGLWVSLWLGSFYRSSRVFLKPEGRSRIRGNSRLVLCSKCKKPMEKVEDTIVKSQLSRIERVANYIGSIKFEGWRCPQCSPEVNDEAFHLVGWVSTSSEFKQCPHCQELTVKHTEETIKEATLLDGGECLITDKCYACAYYEESEKRTPCLILANSGSDSSDSSDSSSGSSFGGGSSGGGGSGSSW